MVSPVIAPASCLQAQKRKLRQSQAGSELRRQKAAGFTGQKTEKRQLHRGIPLSGIKQMTDQHVHVREEPSEMLEETMLEGHKVWDAPISTARLETQPTGIWKVPRSVLSPVGRELALRERCRGLT